jgi:hypothetical protein
VALAPLRDRPGHEVDAELARQLARPCDRAALQRLGAGEVVGRRTADVEPLGEHDQLGALRRCRAGVTLSRHKVGLGVGARLQLDGGCPHLITLPLGRLTD